MASASARLYGSGTPLDLGRVNDRATPRAYGLRSGSSPTGYYRASQVTTNRKRKVKVNSATNLVDAISEDVYSDNEYTIPKVYKTEVDFDIKHRPAYN